MNTQNFLDWKTLSVKNVEKYLKTETDVNAKDGWTPLHFAALVSSSPQVVTVLFNAGAKPEIKTQDGNTAWDYMIKNKDLKDRIHVSYQYKKCVNC